jgi:hypothetical protein
MVSSVRLPPCGLPCGGLSDYPGVGDRSLPDATRSVIVAVMGRTGGRWASLPDANGGGERSRTDGDRLGTVAGFRSGAKIRAGTQQVGANGLRLRLS